MPVASKVSLQVSLENYREDPVPPSQVSVAALWERYRVSADQVARDALLTRHLSLVHFVARRMAAKTTVADYGELVSAGTLGLLSALEAFDSARGYAFSTYAVTRIRGAILDDLRRQDWMPRSSRSRSRRLSAARSALASRHLRAPRPTEVAAELGLNLETYWRWCDELDVPPPQAAPLATEQAEPMRSPGAPTWQASADDASPDARLLREEQRARVRAAIEQLPDREQKVLALCYYEELTLKAVGDLLGVTESRVSQIRQTALQHLARILEP